MNKPSNRQRSVIMALAFMTLLPAGASLFGQQTFGTTIYLDYTCYMSKSGPKTMAPPDTPSFKNNFFNFRRAYFTYENKINDNLKFRFRYDADNTANLTSVDVKTGSTKKDDKLRPFIKHVYLDYAGLLPNSSLKVGMTETLTFKIAEEKWGYRSVAKTLTDGYKDVTGKEIDATSADVGVSFTHNVSKSFRYAAMVSSGSHYSHIEGDKYKKLMAQVQILPLPGLTFAGYVDYEQQAAVTGSPEAYTYKADIFLEMVRNLVIGFEYFSYDNDTYVLNSKRYKAGGLSVFGRYAITPDQFGLFARFDSYEPNSELKDDEMSLMIAGFDWCPVNKSWKIQPNVFIYNYKNGKIYNPTMTKNSDIVLNLTFFLSF